LKKQGIIITETWERARRFAENKFSNEIVKITKEEIETNDCIYKIKGYSRNNLRGYRGFEKVYIQYDIPVGAYFDTVRYCISENADIRFFD
jgi:hypothetical protein